MPRPLGWFAFLRGHFQSTRGPLAFGLVVAILLAPLLSLLRPAVGRNGLAAVALGLAVIAVCLNLAYVVSATRLYFARSDRRLHDDESSGLAVLAWFGLWLAFGVGPVAFAEWHAPPQGWLVELVPELNEEQVRWLGVAPRIAESRPPNGPPDDAPSLPDGTAPVATAPAGAATAGVATAGTATNATSTAGNAATAVNSGPDAATRANAPASGPPANSVASETVGQGAAPSVALDPADTGNPFELEDETAAPAPKSPAASTPPVSTPPASTPPASAPGRTAPQGQPAAPDSRNPFETDP